MSGERASADSGETVASDRLSLACGLDRGVRPEFAVQVWIWDGANSPPEAARRSTQRMEPDTAVPHAQRLRESFETRPSWLDPLSMGNPDLCAVAIAPDRYARCRRDRARHHGVCGEFKRWPKWDGSNWVATGLGPSVRTIRRRGKGLTRSLLRHRTHDVRGRRHETEAFLDVPQGRLSAEIR
jgi:hypothetical protein